MTAIILTILIAALFLIAAGWHHECKAHARTKKGHQRTYAFLVSIEEELAKCRESLAESEGHREAVKQAALKGAPVVKWYRGLASGTPNEDPYLKVKIDGRWRLFTDDELNDRPLKRAEAWLTPACTKAHTEPPVS